MTTYLDPTYREITGFAEQQGDERFVFMGSREPVPLGTERSGGAPVPEGAVPIEVRRKDLDRRLGQFAAAEESLDELEALFEKPRRLGMGCRREYPGVVGQLVVLVPVSDLGGLFGSSGATGRDGSEAWRESLDEPPELGDAGPAPGPAVGGPGATAGEPAAGEGPDGGEPGDDFDVDERMRFGALHLGNVVRFEEDREHPDAFVEEATSMFREALRGDLPPVSDRLIRELAAEGSPGDSATGG